MVDKLPSKFPGTSSKLCMSKKETGFFKPLRLGEGGRGVNSCSINGSIPLVQRPEKKM